MPSLSDLRQYASPQQPPGPNGPMPSPEEIQRYLRATTQEYPKFGAGGIPVNADAFASAVQGFPESTNIEDRRDELGGFDAAAAKVRRRYPTHESAGSIAALARYLLK